MVANKHYGNVRGPRRGELVIVKIVRVAHYGAFAQLVEYPGIEGFLHISEITSKWIKNIHDYVRVGQQTVAKILEYEPHKRVANISLRRVTENERQEILDLYANVQKSKKILETAIKQAKSKVKPEAVLERILQDYENVYDFMLDVYDEGAKVAEEEGLSPKVSSILEELVKKSFKPKKLVIKYKLNAEVTSGDSIEVIKKALLEAEKQADEIKYLGAGTFRIVFVGDDIKAIKKRISKVKEILQKMLEPKAAVFSFEEED